MKDKWIQKFLILDKFLKSVPSKEFYYRDTEKLLGLVASQTHQCHGRICVRLWKDSVIFAVVRGWFGKIAVKETDADRNLFLYIFLE